MQVPSSYEPLRLESIAKGSSASRRDSYAVAAVAPVPLWLSSFALFASNPWVIVVTAVAALIAGGVLVHNGVERLLGVEEEIEASDLAVRVISLGVLAWVVLLMVALVPLLMF